jgi:aminoglycoside N3'-acetyltransferase
MWERHAKILMLGTFQDTNSSLHYCEVAVELPYIHVPFSDDQDFEMAWFFNEHGQVEYTQITEVPGCSRGFRKIEQPLRECGVLTDVRVGAAACQLLDLRALVQAAREILNEDPCFLLCETANCAICPKRRRALGVI